MPVGINDDSVHIFHVKFHKRTLRLRSQIPYLADLGEVGQYTCLPHVNKINTN